MHSRWAGFKFLAGVQGFRTYDTFDPYLRLSLVISYISAATGHKNKLVGKDLKCGHLTSGVVVVVVLPLDTVINTFQQVCCKCEWLLSNWSLSKHYL